LVNGAAKVYFTGKGQTGGPRSTSRVSLWSTRQYESNDTSLRALGDYPLLLPTLDWKTFHQKSSFWSNKIQTWMFELEKCLNNLMLIFQKTISFDLHFLSPIYKCSFFWPKILTNYIIIRNYFFVQSPCIIRYFYWLIMFFEGNLKMAKFYHIYCVPIPDRITTSTDTLF
jgi:hypothetical protein